MSCIYCIIIMKMKRKTLHSISDHISFKTRSMNNQKRFFAQLKYFNTHNCEINNCADVNITKNEYEWPGVST